MIWKTLLDSSCLCTTSLALSLGVHYLLATACFAAVVSPTTLPLLATACFSKRCCLWDRFVLVIRPSVRSRTWVYSHRFVLLICLFVYLVRKLFFQNATSSTIMNGFFWYSIEIIYRRSRIQLVLGVAIWRFLAIWRLILFSLKNGLVYREAINQLWRHNGFVLNTVLSAREWDTSSWSHSQPIRIEGSNSQIYPS